MTQKTVAEGVIQLTLYKKQDWHPAIKQKDGKLFLTKAVTKLPNDAIVTVDYTKSKVYVNGKQQRLPKELRTDLLNIVRLKITKIIKHATFN